MEEKKQYWYFTFGVGHEHSGSFVKLYGTFEEAREKMYALFEDNWCRQYSTQEDAGVEERGLIEMNSKRGNNEFYI